MNQPSQDSLLILDSLRRAVAKVLERKRRLGQYAVIWQDGKVVRIDPVPEGSGMRLKTGSNYLEGS